MTAPLNTTLYMRPDRNLALELVRVTEAGAMAAGRWVGRGDKEAGDGAAVDAMRQLVSSVSMRGVVVIGEGEKDEAPMLYNGEEVGNPREARPINWAQRGGLASGGKMSPDAEATFHRAIMHAW